MSWDIGPARLVPGRDSVTGPWQGHLDSERRARPWTTRGSPCSLSTASHGPRHGVVALTRRRGELGTPSPGLTRIRYPSAGALLSPGERSDERPPPWCRDKLLVGRCSRGGRWPGSFQVGPGRIIISLTSTSERSEHYFPPRLPSRFLLTHSLDNFSNPSCRPGPRPPAPGHCSRPTRTRYELTGRPNG